MPVGISRLAWPLALVFCIAGASLYWTSHRPAHFTGGDEGAYLAAAYHLLHHSTFSEAAVSDAAPQPAVGREPGYAVLLAVLMGLDPAFRSFTLDCLRGEDRCDPAILEPVQKANLFLIGLAGFVLFATMRLTAPASPSAAWIAAFYIIANVEMNADWYYVQSDYLAMFLVTLLMLATAWAARGTGWVRWMAVGTALAALTFVKAVFLVFAVVAVVMTLAVAILAVRGRPRRLLVASAMAAGIVWSVPVGAWMVRNADVVGDLRFTDNRAGIALNTREVFNHWTTEQFLASFVYWTRGFGNDLAERWFSPEIVAPFRIDNPDGFYLTRQNGYFDDIRSVMAETGLGIAAATEQVDTTLKLAILERPLTHLATTIPVFYRGLWVDEFVLLGLPALLWILIAGISRGPIVWVLLVAPGIFNLLFYPLISLNIDRYQMTAVPALALGAALAIVALGRMLHGRFIPPRKSSDLCGAERPTGRRRSSAEPP